MLSTHRSHHRARSLSALGLVPLCFACSNGEVDLGRGVITQSLGQPSRCATSSVLAGDVTITTQSELESLAGCEQITGSLRIEIFAGTDLSPLSSLRVVGDVLSIGDTPALTPETPEAQLALQTLQDDGYLPSLHGLESLESVRALLLTSLQINDLTELESLTSIQSALIGNNLLHLQSLAGIERVALEDLWLTNIPALTSLDGLLMVDTVDSIIIESAPALTNIDAIADVDFVNSLYMLSGTGLVSLPQLVLSGAAQISIDNNVDLVDIEGIAGVVGCQQLHLAANPKLRTFPEFSGLMDLDFLTIVNNGFESISLSFPAFAPQSYYIQDREVTLSAPVVEIALNPQLTRFEIPAGFADVQNFSIYENEQLAEIDLGTLQHADLLIIDGNAALTSIAAPQLATVNRLEVTNNPLLDPTVFDDVRAFSREVSVDTAP